jgi:hypothetical protein
MDDPHIMERAMAKATGREQRWLARLVGEWTFETSFDGPAGEPAKSLTGTERVRSLDGVWTIAEGSSDMGGTLLTLGFDTARGRVVGSYVGSMLTSLWVYDGVLEGDTLAVDTEGPSFLRPGETGRYRDVFAFDGDDARTLTSHERDADGEWRAFMTTRFRRTA